MIEEAESSKASEHSADMSQFSAGESQTNTVSDNTCNGISDTLC